MSDELKDRKQRHLEICLDRSIAVESGSTGLADIRLPHRALPETDASQVSLETPFLGSRLKLPIMISCMTGGSEDGRTLNRMLARIAGEAGLAIGTGSIRVMLRHPETRSHFDLKTLAPDTPVLANIGAAQLVEYPPAALAEAVKSIEADGLYVHLNPAQELFQNDGDRLFTGWYDGFRRLLDEVDIPVLVKETGAGIPPIEGLRLLKAGVAFVDVAGAGGTDWVAVESFRIPPERRQAAESFRGWGYSTAELILAYRQIAKAGGSSGEAVKGRLIASGGLRTPMDFAVSLACGAWLSAAALPFIRAAAEGGPDAVFTYIAELEKGIRSAVILSGSGTLESFRVTDLRVPADLSARAENLAEDALRIEAGS
jgi:isopentenyl-diphosphate delta-isomerase type 2